ncbi:RHS repeat domain-containing protein [Streptomyces sp. URMC 124]|uniref:RHS repeat domain-containing protein n=1 Tax=Streptomyces sp. URMC 124 TaxID=3423405 RepID=UPI003F1AC362
MDALVTAGGRAIRFARRRGAASVLGAVLAGAMTVSLLPADIAAAGGRKDFKPRAVQQTRSVPGKPLAGRDGRSLSETDTRAGQSPRARWPKAAEKEIEVAGNGKAAVKSAKLAAGADGFPVRIVPADGAAGTVLRSSMVTDARAAGEPTRPKRVKVRIADHATATKAGVEGVLIGVSRSDGQDGPGRASVEVDYSAFRDAYGAGWGSRLQLVRLPACALTTPDKQECRTATPLAAHNDAKNEKLTAQVDVPGAPRSAVSSRTAVTVLAATAAPSGDQGDFKATSLSPSGSWKAGGNAGGFSWSYPLQVPPVPGDLAPKLGLDYSSAAIDGRTAATNNQASWVGDGWSMEAGFIERQFMACKEDNGKGSNAPKESGDLCWRSDNAVMSLNGKNTPLVKDTKDGVWRPAADDGSRVEHLKGSDQDTANGDDDNEYWKVTTTAGTQYWFGKNRLPGWTKGKPETRSAFTAPVFGNHEGEPGHQSAFKDSARDQAWRWNLDYVVDPHGNAMTFFYEQETNAYAKNSGGTHTSKPKADAGYVRGGHLTRAEYGLRAGDALTGKPAAKVLFTTADRCLATECAFDKKSAENWPDTPFDQFCEKDKECMNGSPSFWSKKRLTAVTTQALKGDSYQDVDTWALGHSFPGVGDAGGPSLWLTGVTRTGKAGGTPLSMPRVTFGGTLMPNRVDAAEGRPPMNKYRITRISSETGADTLVRYSAPECVAGKLPEPQSNAKRCFPTYWTPKAAVDPVKDWFHKYVVTDVTENDKVGGQEPKVTAYEYLGGIAWAKDTSEFTPEKQRTYSDFRGYGKVRTRTGTAGRTLTESVFLRGIEGDKVTDSSGTSVTDALEYAGFTLENATYDGDGGKMAKAAIKRPWSRKTAAQKRDGTTDLTAHLVAAEQEITRDVLSDGTWRTTRSAHEFDDHGQIVATSDEGDTAVTGDEMCTRTTFAYDKENWLLGYPSTLRRTSASCGTTDDEGNILNEIRTSYDGRAHGEPPVQGKANPTKVEELDRFEGGKPVVVTTSTHAYDAVGRVVEESDAAGRRTRTAYAPAAGAQPTKITTTNPKGYVTTAETDGLRGATTKATDVNGRTTTQQYDALGRLVAAWKPGRSTSAPADVLFSYDVRGTAPTAVTSKTLLENGKYRTAITLYDGLLRTRQTQTDAHGGKGRLITDTFYDSHGRTYKANAEYYNGGATTGTILAVADNKVPQQTITEFDGQGRPTATVFASLNVEKWRSTTSYGGNWTATVPPGGGTATLTVANVRGKPVEVRQYKGGKPVLDAPAGSYEATKYGYDSADRLTRLVDAVGNTWTAEYDLRGRRTKSSDPDKGTIRMTYTPDGQVATVTDALGHTLATTYDDLGRRTSVREGNESGEKRAEWVYDTLPGGKGRLTSSARYEKGNAYTVAVTGYDDGGRATGSTVTVPEAEGKLAGSYTFTSVYTPNTGLAAQTVFPAGGGLPAETIRHGYTDFGLPTTLSGSRVYSLGNEYAPSGDLLQTVLGTVGRRTVQTFTYETDTRRLGGVTEDREADGPQTIDHKAYSYDPIGNVTRIRNDREDKKTTDTQCFVHDFARRLTDAWTAADDCSTRPSGDTRPKIGGTDPYWYSYSYDSVGNRTAETRHDPAGEAGKDVRRAYAYPKPGTSLPHAMTAVGITGPGARSDSFEYDKAGNTVRRVTAGGDQRITWDAEGHMASSTIGDKTSTFLYDADGRRLLRRDPEAVTLYLDSQELRLDTKTGKVSGKRFLTAKNATIVVSSDGGVSYVLNDHNGTPDLTVDAESLRFTRRASGPFGTARGPQPAAGQWPSDHGFVGGTKDESTGLTHVGAREYDADNGRFLSVDPVLNAENPQQANGYAYANNSPVSNSDPSGAITIGDLVGMVPGMGQIGAVLNMVEYGMSQYRSYTRSSPSYSSARRQMWDRGEAGGRFGHFNVGKGKDRGIIMVRYFIHTREAMKVIPGMPGWLMGDDRGFSSDPAEKAYRMVLFWDTASGDVTFKIAPSHTLPRKTYISSYAQGGNAAPIEVDVASKRVDANQLIIDDSGGELDTLTKNLTLFGKNVLQTRDSNSQRLNLGLHAVQPLLSIGSVDNDLTIAANESTITVRRQGDAYPDMEAVQYRRNVDVPTYIGVDKMANTSGYPSLPPWPNMNRSWTVPTNKTMCTPESG